MPQLPCLSPHSLCRAAAAAAVLCLFALTGASARDLPTGPSLDAVQAAPLAGAGQAAPSVEDYAALLASAHAPVLFGSGPLREQPPPASLILFWPSLGPALH